MALNAVEIARGESATLEFKLTLPKDTEKFTRTVIAFANCQGGRIIFGIDDHSHCIVGIEADEVFPMMDAIANAISDSCTPQIIPNIEPQTIDGKNVIVVNVRPQYNRPYYLSGKGRDKGTYVRVGATSRPADEDKVTDLLMEGKRISWDELSCMEYPVVQEDVNRLCEEIRNHRIKAGLSDRLPDAGQLVSMKVLKKDELGLHASNAFALLTSSYFQFAKIQCALFKGCDRGVFIDKKEFEGPIYGQIDEAVNFVLRNIRLGVTIGKVLRHEKYELPPEAIREMIINAVCHRDYRLSSCVQVSVFDDRLEISSPGGLYNGLTFDEMIEGHSSIRNRSVATVFQQMGIIEKWGTGIRRICNLAADYGLLAPKFTISENFFTIELFRTNALISPCISGMINGGNQKTAGGEFGGIGITNSHDLSQLAECLLKAIAVDPHRTALMLAKEIGVPLRTVEREISALRKAGILARKGAPRTGYWQIIK